MQYEFDWNNVKILDEEPFYRKLKLSEMIKLLKNK